MYDAVDLLRYIWLFVLLNIYIYIYYLFYYDLIYDQMLFKDDLNFFNICKIWIKRMVKHWLKSQRHHILKNIGSIKDNLKSMHHVRSTI